MKLSYEDHDTITVLKISGALTADQVDSVWPSLSTRMSYPLAIRFLD